MPEKIKPRMHRRIPIATELNFTGDVDGAGVLLEMSEGGLSFSTHVRCETGQYIRLRLQDEEESFFVEGNLVSVNAEGDGLRCGLAFSSMPASALLSVRAFLKRHQFSRFRV